MSLNRPLESTINITSIKKCQFTNIINYAKLLIQLYSGQGINLLGIFFFFLMEHASMALTNTIIDY